MAFSHHYNLIKGGEDVKDGEEVRDDSQLAHAPVVTSWWKLVLCNVVAACVGAGVMFLLAGGSPVVQSSSSPAVSSSAANMIASAISSAALAHPTHPALPPVEGDTSVPNMEVGTILDCGGSPAEARAKGCVFDVMMQDWVPEPCYDKVLTDKYLTDGNYTWYGDGDGKTTISDEQMRKGEHGAAWMSTSYHKAHCVFSWLKIIRALRNKRGISQELLSYDHVLHCSHGALRESSTDTGLGVQAPTNYAKCALYETWEYELIPDKHDSTQ